VLGIGTLSVFDGYINTVIMARDINNNVQMIIETARVLTFTVHETPTEYIIRPHLPRDIFPYIVVIDPGHGGAQPGTGHHGIVEKDLVLRIAQKLMQLLDNHSYIQVYATRLGDDTVSNPRRASFANAVGADLFLSIHANAARNNAIPNGIETWYTPSYYYTQNQMTNRQFSAIIQRHKLEQTGAANRGLRSSQGLIVTRDTNMPAALSEVGFLTNPAEAARLRTTEYQWQLARALYYGILEALRALPSRL